ncbi:Hypothetical protein SCLAV_2235 [Streptomyces clavuligerus]|uniref:Uncharacterized protein n=1 Tax=Streptomyces clavuligerus TaxID=1901 RepID=E2Q6I4_STRCL|nr:Hypothetical protein SCLAV_2235 [Streptomyces clavuligerus]
MLPSARACVEVGASHMRGTAA